MGAGGERDRLRKNDAQRGKKVYNKNERGLKMTGFNIQAEISKISGVKLSYAAKVLYNVSV